MREVELILVRHARAAARPADGSDDPSRPLVPKGERQAARLAGTFEALGLRPSRLFTSPWTRAASTAEALAPLAAAGRAEPLDALAAGDPERLLAALAEELEGSPPEPVVALVGHEPWLSELAARLIGGGERAGGRAALRLRKASLAVLGGRLEPGGMELRALLPMRMIERLRSR